MRRLAVTQTPEKKTSANTDVKNSRGANNDNNIDFAVPADHRVKLKEGEKKDKNLDLARKLEKLWNMKIRLYQL